MENLSFAKNAKIWKYVLFGEMSAREVSIREVSVGALSSEKCQ